MPTSLLLGCIVAIVHASAPGHQVPAAQAVTFHAAVAHAMAFETGAALAELAVADPEATRLAARSALSPNVYALGTYTRLDHDRGLGGSRLLAGKNQINGQLGAIVPLVHARRWAGYREGAKAVDAAKRSHRDAQRNAAIAAAVAYLDVVTAKRQASVAQQAVQTAQAHYAIAQARLASGIGNRLDVLRADDTLGESQVLQETALGSVVATMERLGVVMGRNAPADVAEEWPERLDVSHDVADAEGDHVHERLDIAAAYAQLRYAQQVRQDS